MAVVSLPCLGGNPPPPHAPALRLPARDAVAARPRATRVTWRHGWVPGSAARPCWWCWTGGSA